MEGNCSQKKKKADLIDLMFSWSLEDIFNEDLYKDKVEKIPESFQSEEHYLGSFVFPLLEETRAELSSSMKVICRAPLAEVVSVKESKPFGKLLYNIQIDSWKNRFYNSGKEPYRTLPGDVFVITDVKPESSLDLQQSGRTLTLGLVPKIAENKNSLNVGDSTTTFKVKASKDVGLKDGLQKSLYVVFLMNITTNNRVWDSLHSFKNVNVIKEVLCSNSVVEEICNQCSLYSNAICAERFALKLSPVLNESQRAAVLSSLCKMHCNHKSSVELIWGPPGTGKTKTVSMLLWAVLGMNYRILTCAPTNVAVTELASRVVKLVKERFENESKRSELFCSLGDFLLFGNKDRLKIVSDLEDIYLDYRIDRLSECFSQLTGWKHCFTSMINFLEDSVSQYHIFLENILCKKKNQSSEELKSFGEFLGVQFKSIALPLRRCVQIFCTHVPKSVIMEHNFQNIVFLVKLLDSFESLLCRNDVVSAELEELFSCPEVVQDSPYSPVHTLTLQYVRTQLLCVLRTLRSSLDHLKLPSFKNKHSIRRFCFQRASLIFCTASNSYKLHSEKIEPLNLLVIDEAAQLKECESTIALQLLGIRHAILIGDEYQLRATVTSKVSDEAGFGRSLFERLSLLGHSKHLLNIQYRMQSSIFCFPNSRFYLNEILDAPIVKSKSYVKYYLPGPMFGPYSFISVLGGREELDIGRSRKNLVEVAVAMKIVQKLYKAYCGSKQKISIGIVSPYASQVMAIQEKLGRKYDKLDGFTVKVKSIDGFQGGEEDIIIISTVRSNRSSSIGFISNPQRTNVALTRARHCLWILGSGTTLENSESVWEAVVRDAKLRQCFFNADEDKDLAKAILEVKEELVQLDDLLDKDSILFRTSRWKVLLCNNFWKSFGELKSSQAKKLVIVFLLKLSTGWRPTERSKGFIAKVSSQILYHFKVEDRYIVWTVDVEKVSKYVQVLKVWDILPLEDVRTLVECLNGIFRMYSDDFLNHCKAKCLEGDLEIPLSWVSSSDIVQYKNLNEIEPDGESNAAAFDGRTYFEYSNVERSLLLRKFYPLSYLVVNHLLSGRDCRELDLPCQVTDQELEIILFPESTFVVGRPSIEKTSLLTMKLFQKEQQHYLASEGFYDKRRNIIMDNKWKNNVGESMAKTKETVLRQIFITVSPKLCAIVKQHVSHLKSFTYNGTFSAESSSIDLDDVDDAAQLLDIPDNFVNIPPKSYPLVVTFGKFLVMLDRTLGDSYFKRFHNIREDIHAKTGTSYSFALQAFISTKVVNYDRFCSSYWPHFSIELTKKLDASTVFTEIFFHIKGGMETIEACDAKMSREDYVLLRGGQFPTLSTKRREKIYDIFLDYEKKKMENGEFDLADLVIDLHRRLKNHSYEGDKMDFVYVDEVQGLTMREITLFKYICRNAYRGFVFSGDMAQTIARGSGFKFQDIRTLFYKEFILGSRNNGNDGGTEEGQISDIFHLSQSLHTHGGILNIGQSVIDLLFRFFPLSIDILCPETGAISLIDSELPILLEPVKNENTIISLFGNSGNASKSTVSFGAEQVILVRDDCARDEIIALVGKQAIVLTIMECQGLEFQDVLLYNFFGSSPFKRQWRIIYAYMKEQDMLDSSASRSFSSFDQARQNGLCLELKLLYVAITRSRKRLWISENAKELSNPMFDYWKKLCLVEIRRVDDSQVQEMQVGSSEEEWRSRGIKLYCEGRYEMAMMCFTRAGDKYRENWANAASLRTAAEHFRGSNPEMAHEVLSKAAELFNSIGRDESAAQCFLELKEYEKAGAIYFEKYGESRLDDACNCFLLAGCYKRAAEACARGNDFSKCLSICTSRKFFDMGLQFIQSRRQHVTPEVGLVTKCQELKKIEHNFLEKCALHYHELQDNKTMMKFVRAFNSLDSKRLFLKNLNCFDELLLLEKESGNFMEAAAIAKLKGDLLLEVDLLEKAGRYRDASMLILFYISAKSLWASGNKGWPLKPFRRKEKLIERARILAKNVSNDFCEFVITEANILSNQAKSFSEMKKYLTASDRQQNLGCVILSTRKILDAHLQSINSMYEWKDEFVMDLMKLSEERISQNCISVETLIYFWSLWKEKIANIIEYLGCLKTQDINENMRFGEFCLNYFGVWKETDNQNSIFLLFNSDAEWAKIIDDRLLQRKRDLVGVDAHQFFSAAKAYWCSEVLSVGMKILEKLQALHGFSIVNSLPKSCQSKTALHIFEVAKFLTEFKFLESSMDHKTLQKLFDMGLQSILNLKNVSPDLGTVNGSQEMGRIMHDFLVKCAVYYHVLKNKRAMMKFVRAFDSMNSRRSLLRALDCFDELLLLEEESGNFVEAATIAKLKGDLFLEVDLLEKAGHYKDASMLILFYVLAHSLWASGNKGWPLKQFRQKDKLLTKAKSIAENNSNIFHEFVCTEANILSNQASNLFEIKQNFDASLRQENLRGEILSAWKILDAHLRLKPSNYVWQVEPVTNPTRHSEEMVSQNQVSIETLVYFWNYWKEKILKIFDYLRCLETQDVNENTSCEGFCLSYMGVRKEFTVQNSIYILVNSDFDWVKEIDDGSLQRNGKSIRINATQFVSAAQSYWCSQVVSVGTAVLEILEALHMFSVRNSVSMFCQSMTALHFFEVTEFLMGFKFLQSSANKILQKFFDVRSQFIQYCKQHVAPDTCTLNGNHGIYEIEQVFREKCALHYHDLQDKRNMMKFVKDFHSMDSKRAFLKTMDCFDELLLLEEQQGNFVEAASIARLQGDLFLEVDLLQKAGHFKDAAMLILSYALANSLWTPESKGWPLKQFMQKEDLLIKAKSFALNHSDVFYKFVCTEVNILLNQESSLSEMKEYLSASQRNNSIIGEILSARKILDAHFNLDTSKFEWEDELIIELMTHSEDRISRNQVSVETLVCFWNFWKEKMVNIFQYLGCLETKDVAGYATFENFCLSYLGVRKQFVDQGTVYLLFNSGSNWVRKIDDGSLQRSGKLVGLDARQFAAAAWSYWSSEVFSVGMKVLEKLVALHMFSVENSSLFCQGMTSIRIFEIAKFLMESELLKRSPDNRVLQNFLNYLPNNSLRMFFP
ncbi:hypothetical protein F0562_032389 [Nyssa sinensis]|uniref:UvrD-like helicase ATP-binding domain-containing protein n=1 Tax=Nyssa sinensis TaxID=561372 RepID=A0A5J5AML4_9ASTE|nr:hypothetical protein F0562_032389 [Nyssa sinensis]